MYIPIYIMITNGCFIKDYYLCIGVDAAFVYISVIIISIIVYKINSKTDQIQPYV